MIEETQYLTRSLYVGLSRQWISWRLCCCCMLKRKRHSGCWSLCVNECYQTTSTAELLVCVSVRAGYTNLIPGGWWNHLHKPAGCHYNNANGTIIALTNEVYYNTELLRFAIQFSNYQVFFLVKFFLLFCLQLSLQFSFLLLAAVNWIY